MIQVKFKINIKELEKTKKFQFCRNHEKNLDIIYEIAKESIEKRRKSDLEQLMIICCVHVVKEIRKNTIREIIQGRLLKELTKYEGMIEFLNNIKNISIEAKIDNFPKENLNFSREM